MPIFQLLEDLDSGRFDPKNVTYRDLLATHDDKSLFDWLAERDDYHTVIPSILFKFVNQQWSSNFSWNQNCILHFHLFHMLDIYGRRMSLDKLYEYRMNFDQFFPFFNTYVNFLSRHNFVTDFPITLDQFKQHLVNAGLHAEMKRMLTSIDTLEACSKIAPKLLKLRQHAVFKNEVFMSRAIPLFTAQQRLIDEMVEAISSIKPVDVINNISTMLLFCQLGNSLLRGEIYQIINDWIYLVENPAKLAREIFYHHEELLEKLTVCRLSYLIDKASAELMKECEGRNADIIHNYHTIQNMFASSNVLIEIDVKYLDEMIFAYLVSFVAARYNCRIAVLGSQFVNRYQQVIGRAILYSRSNVISKQFAHSWSSKEIQDFATMNRIRPIMAMIRMSYLVLLSFEQTMRVIDEYCFNELHFHLPCRTDADFQACRQLFVNLFPGFKTSVILSFISSTGIFYHLKNSQDGFHDYFPGHLIKHAASRSLFRPSASTESARHGASKGESGEVHRHETFLAVRATGGSLVKEPREVLPPDFRPVL